MAGADGEAAPAAHEKEVLDPEKSPAESDSAEKPGFVEGGYGW